MSDPIWKRLGQRGIRVLLGVALASGGAIAKSTSEPAINKVDDIRTRLLLTAPQPSSDSQRKATLAQWYNWPNWNNWGNWSNWPNWPNWGNWLNR